MEKARKKTSSKIAKLLIISVILTVICEVVTLKLTKTFSEISLARSLTIFGIITFIGLHFTIGFKKLYNIIVQKRFIISGILIVVSTIIGFFMNSVSFKEWITRPDIVLGLWWNIKFYGLLLASFELFYIITNKKQGLSVIGTVVLTFSSFIQWNFRYIAPIIFEELVVIFVNKLLTKDKRKRILNSLGIILSVIICTFLYESYTIAFGYVFLGLIIWLFIKNRESLKDKSLLITTIITFIITVVTSIISKIFLAIPFVENMYLTRNGISYLFSYLNNFLLPFYDISNAKEFASIVSLFPVPMLIALYYMYKKEKHTEFLMPITIITVLETVFCLAGFPDIINKITGFDIVNVSVCASAVGLANLFIIFYFLGNVDEELFKTSHAIRFCLVVICLLIFVGRPDAFMAQKYLYFFVIEMCILSFLFLFWGDKKYKNVFLFFLVTITLIGGVFVNPILKDKSDPLIEEEQIIMPQN